jgi:TolA-binding protein
MIHKFRYLLIISILIAESLSAQQTEIYKENDRPYKTAYELFIKEKYSAAMELFDNYISDKKGSEHNTINAAYYSAIASFELFNPDAENKLIAFTDKYPESTKTPLAWFNLGRQYYRTKKFPKALPAFEKADVYYLTGDEVAEYYFKIGYCYFSKNDNEKAAKKFYEILNVNSKYQTAAQYYYGHIAYNNNNFKTALEYFSKLDSSATFGPLVPYYITQIYYEQLKYDEVIKYAVPVLENTTPQNAADITRIVAESYYRKGDFKNAHTYFQKYQASVPVISRDDRYSIAYCEYRAEDYKNAIENFEKVVDFQDSLAQNAYYHLADCFLKSNNKQSARNAFQYAGKLTHNSTITEISQFNYAKLSYELGFQPVALNAFRDFLKNYPNSKYADESNELIAGLYLTTRNYKDALTALDNVKNKTTKTKEAYQKVAYYRGVEFYNDGDRDKAIGMFEKAILNDVNPNIRAQAMYWKAEALYGNEKYDAAVKQYRIFIFNTASPNTELYNVAHYGLGYAHFKQANYQEAQTWFRKYIAKKEETTKDKYDDALLRIGDCFYVLRDFDNAKQFYSDAINNKASSSDYALFQKGLIQGFQGDLDGKSATMNTLLSNYPKSKYKADGLFEKGRAQMTAGNNESARGIFNQLLTEFPSSQYSRKALLNLGLIAYSEKQDEIALTNFKKVISTYPGSPEATEALASVKNIYVADGKPEAYFDYVKTVSKSSVSAGAQDSITYEAAEQRYLAQKFDEASSSFTKYLQQFPDGAFKLNATFYKAECDFRVNKLDDALVGYETIIQQPKNIYSEKSLLKAANLNFKKGLYDKAIEQYNKLEQTGDLRDNIINAQAGQMRGYYKSNKYEQAITYAQKLLSAEKVDNELLSEAHLTYGRAALQTNDLTSAKREYALIAKQSGANGAEARYSLALIEYKLSNYKTSQTKCFDVINQVPSYDFWIGKSFLLLSDNYIALKDTFQAKHTLQSLIDNYENDPSDPEDIKAMAQEKYNEISVNETKDLLKPADPIQQETDLTKENK